MTAYRNDAVGTRSVSVTLLVLLGAPVTADGVPGPALARRLGCALELLRHDPEARLLATGGVPPRALSAEAEAVVVARVLKARGIPAARVLLEPNARNTWENAARSARLLRAGQQTFDPVLLVTDPWHLPRALLAFRAHGLRVRGAGCRVTAGERPGRLLRLLAHEVLGYGSYLLRWGWLLLRHRLGKPVPC